MSNLQDVPLAEPENMPTTEEETAGPKSNSLKRFFKLGRKSTGQDFSEDVNELEDQEEANKEAPRPGNISRFLTRLKGTSKSGNVHFEESASTINTAEKEATGKPEPSAKPTLRTSISGYWKQLFHRQKAANRQDGNQITNEVPVASQEVQQEQQTEPTQTEHGLIPSAEKSSEVKPGKSMETCVPEILEEVQMLAVSDEIVDPSHEESKKED